MRSRASWERRLALVALGLGLVALFGGIAGAIAAGEMVRGAYLSLVAGVALLLASVILDPRTAVDLIRARQLRFGALSVVVTAMLIGVLVLVNVIASRSLAQVDLTKAGAFSLSPQSIQVTRSLTHDLQVTGYFRASQKQDRRTAEELLNLYRQESPHVKVTWKDPDQDSLGAQRLGVTIPGSLVLQYLNRPPIVLNLASQSEADLTGGIIKLQSSRTPEICWVSGDGERGVTSSGDQTSYSSLSQVLQQSNYTVKELPLSLQGKVPADCDVLAIVGPTKAISATAQQSVSDYLKGGGKLLVAFGPWEDPSALAPINTVLQPYDVGFAGGLVVETNAGYFNGQDPTTSLVTNWGSSPITKNLAGLAVLLPHPTSITGSPSGSASDLATSSSSAYLITQPRDISTQLGRRAGDSGGPFTLMRTVEQDEGGGKTTRITLIGSPDAGENTALSSGANNQDLMSGTFDWLTEQNTLINITSKPLAQPIPLTQSELYLNGFITLVLVPGAIVAIGVAVFIRRRRMAVA